MKISQAFPSKYLKSEDIPARKKVGVVIESVSLESLGDEDKPIVYFEGKTKGLVLNKTNAGRIAAAHGDDTDDWTGKKIYLFVEQVLFSGRMVPSIRVDVPMETVEAAPKASHDDEPPF